MSSDTVDCFLDDLCLKITDGSHQSPKAFDGGMPMFSVKDMTEFGFDFSSVKTISKKDYDKLVDQGCRPLKNDVLIAKDGSVLKHVFKVERDLDAVLLSSIALLRPNTDLINPDYLVYSLMEPRLQRNIKSNYVSGSGVPRIVLKDFKKIPLSIPSLDVQSEIVDHIKTIDRKIYLNLQTNETLEAMAQAIFKSWFVDFDPVRAKIKANEDGRDPNRVAMAAIAGVSLEQDWNEVETVLNQKLERMSVEQQEQLKNTAGLFPEMLEESEIGDVPKDWEVVEIQDEIDFQNGKAFRSKDLEKDLNRGLRVFKMGNIEKGGGFERIGGNDFLPPDFEDDVSRYMLRKGDLLMCMTDMKNNVALLGHTALMDVDDEYVLNQRVGRLRRKKSSYLRFPFLYYLTNSEGFIEDLRSRANSGVQVNLSTKEIKASKFLLPPEGVHNHYDRVIGNLLEQKFHNDKENVTLSELRDTLLPKLISREFGV